MQTVRKAITSDSSRNHNDFVEGMTDASIINDATMLGNWFTQPKLSTDYPIFRISNVCLLDIIAFQLKISWQRELEMW